MRTLVCLVSLLAITAAVSGAPNLLVNGDFSQAEPAGWTRWWAPWGNYGDWTIAGGTGYTSLPATTTPDTGPWNSYGWYQAVAVPVGDSASVSGTWRGDVDPYGWAEIMLFSVPVGTDAGVITNRIDTGANADVAFKKDGWTMNPPQVWDWQLASLSPHPEGNGGTVTSQGLVVVATKIGTGDWNKNHSLLFAEFDQITLVPEPSSLLLLGLGLPLLRRRRA